MTVIIHENDDVRTIPEVSEYTLRTGTTSVVESCTVSITYYSLGVNRYEKHVLEIDYPYLPKIEVTEY